jgi:proline iminopeptidase
VTTMTTRDPLSWLYPPSLARREGWLEVGDGHRLRWEEAGCPDGAPVILLHGGPGFGVAPDHRRFFDPRRYRVILVDQRGAGQSTPRAATHANTTWHLVSDLERLREALGVDRWHVFGGSWGSTLALAYAETHPARVRSLVLRGIFLGRPHEVRWLYAPGLLSQLHPEAWEDLLAPLPPEDRDDPEAGYRRLLTSPDRAAVIRACRAFARWEAVLSHVITPPEALAAFDPLAPVDVTAPPEAAEALTRLELHYFAHGCFLRPDQLLADVGRIRHIPTAIVHGRYDLVCPVATALDLARALPEAALQLVADGGHSAFDPPIARALVAATDRFAHLP